MTLAETTAPVLVFKTGLPTRYYFDRTDVAFEHLLPTATQTACPYKGVTSGYWSVRTGVEVRDGDLDLAWGYNYPTRPLLPITGLVAFYNEKIDLDVDGLPAATGPNPLLQVSAAIAMRRANRLPASLAYHFFFFFFFFFFFAATWRSAGKTLAAIRH